MRVDEVLAFQTYWDRYPSKRPSSRTEMSRRGDNIWHEKAGLWRVVRGALHNETHRARDLRGANALIAEEFYYFGREAIVVPEQFASILATTQGHKNTYDAALIGRFWAWLSRAAPRIGRIGQPPSLRTPVAAPSAPIETTMTTSADRPRNVSGLGMVTFQTGVSWGSWSGFSCSLIAKAAPVVFYDCRLELT